MNRSVQFSVATLSNWTAEAVRMFFEPTVWLLKGCWLAFQFVSLAFLLPALVLTAVIAAIPGVAGAAGEHWISALLRLWPTLRTWPTFLDTVFATYIRALPVTKRVEGGASYRTKLKAIAMLRSIAKSRSSSNQVERRELQIPASVVYMMLLEQANKLYALRTRLNHVVGTEMADQLVNHLGGLDELESLVDWLGEVSHLQKLPPQRARVGRWHWTAEFTDDERIVFHLSPRDVDEGEAWKTQAGRRD